MKVYTDWEGKNPLSKVIIKELILGDNFLVAWWAVSTYVMQMELTPFHKRLMEFQANHKQSLTMAGRGYGKSYTNNTAYTLTRILRDGNIRIAVATQKEDQSKKFINELKAYFKDGGVVYEIFGDLKGDIWQETQFSLKRSKVIKEATVTTASMNASGSFISSHFDIIILDDIVGEENARTKGQREKLERYVFNTVIPTIELQNGYGFIHAIGTHYHPDDFWTTLENSKQFDVLKIPSLYTNKNGEKMSIWEKKKGVKELEKTRELVGHINFNMQYQQKVPKEKGGIFKAKWFRYFVSYENINDVIYVIRKDDEGVEERERVDIYMGVDLAISKRASADSFVITVIGRGVETKNTYLLDMFRGKLSFGEQMDKIKQIGGKWYMAIRIGVESVAYQQALSDELIANTDLPVKKIKTITDKMTRFSKFSGQWENDKVYLNPRVRDLDILEDEVLTFPEGEHDDTLDSLCIAWETSISRKIKRSEVTAGGDLNILGW